MMFFKGLKDKSPFDITSKGLLLIKKLNLYFRIRKVSRRDLVL